MGTSVRWDQRYIILDLTNPWHLHRSSRRPRAWFECPGSPQLLQWLANSIHGRQRSKLHLCRILFFLWFLGILRNVLRSADGEGEWLSTVALSGGLMFITLELAGAAAEIVYPATLARFANFQPDAQLAFLSLSLSGWLYNFAWVGLSVLIAAASALALWIRRLPRWLGWAGFVFAVLALTKFLTPLAHSVALLWVLVVCALMLAGCVSFSR